MKKIIIKLIKKYQQIPFKSNPISSICVGDEYVDEKIRNEVFKNESNSRQYLRAEFIDRRFDYSFFISTPYANDDIDAITNADKGNAPKAWKTGRISGNTYNGIEMIYNNRTDYEVIGNGLEYWYGDKNGTTANGKTNYLDNVSGNTSTYYNNDINILIQILFYHKQNI